MLGALLCVFVPAAACSTAVVNDFYRNQPTFASSDPVATVSGRPQW
ncbi:MAG: hypothetical protein N3I86_15605 [Verrucomicrobiae bacterium]|nr:hypothetical protein [Verrucomicrobiae bacterium]MDW8308465.1 hypothetical protein [Verrucomicrobiales bacterium]